jgi:hypothetical protein
VFAGSCRELPRVDDIESGTLLIGPKQLHWLEPWQSLAEMRDLGAGLPAERGQASVFSRTPLLLEVEKYVHADGFQSSSVDDGFYRLVGERWVLIREGLGEIPIALPVATGTVVVGWTDERAQHHGDPEMVPAGNMTRAWLIALDGELSELASWPAIMTWQQQSAPHTLWAIAAEPRRGGHFLLRLPLGGKPELRPIPGTSPCLGIDRLSAIPTLDAVSDDDAELTVSPYADCTIKKLAGSYHFRAGRFIAAEAPEEPEPSPAGDERQLVRAGGSLFSLGERTLSVLREGVVEALALPELAASGAPVQRNMTVTAGGRELWLRSVSGERCALDRYRWHWSGVAAP